MKRSTFDKIVSWAGISLAALLIVAGSLLTWAHNFVHHEVHNQLAAQKIYFPPSNSKAVQGPEFKAMRQYGGQQLTTGAQAETYADHFIAIHLKEIGGGQTYAQLSSQAIANPNDQALAGKVATMFKGETLRGLLLNAYGWWQVGQIMLISAIVAFCAAGLFLILSGLGFWHLRRAAPEAEVLPKLATRVHANTV